MIIKLNLISFYLKLKNRLDDLMTR